MANELTSEMINPWATDASGPVALVLRQKLLPVEGEDGVIFPPTYAEIGYNIDDLADGTRVACLDSVGSQANRVEPIFKRANGKGGEANPLASLVPQVDIKIGDATVSLLETGHRLGDALVRSTELAEEARKAFGALIRGDATEIARIAPTSIVFGAWDSRDTSAKLPRILQSVIRAWKVEVLTRSAQYGPPVDYAALEVFTDDEKARAEGDNKSPLAQRGFVHVPSVGVPGGVIARGPILREATINLVALRRLEAFENRDELRRYILGLALVAGTCAIDGFLRQGCLLTPDPSAPGEWVAVYRNGMREPIPLSFDIALAYASAAARAFGVGRDRIVEFDGRRAKADLSDAAVKRGKRKGGSRSGADGSDGPSV